MQPLNEAETSTSENHNSKQRLSPEHCKPAVICAYPTSKEEDSLKNKNGVISPEVTDAASSSSEKMINDDSGHGKRRRSDASLTESDRLEERRAKNRISAHQSRLRKRRQLQYLQEQLVALKEDKRKLEETNQSLSLQLAKTQGENTKLQVMHQNSLRIAAALQLQAGQGSAHASGAIPPLNFF